MAIAYQVEQYQRSEPAEGARVLRGLDVMSTAVSMVLSIEALGSVAAECLFTVEEQKFDRIRVLPRP